MNNITHSCKHSIVLAAARYEIENISISNSSHAPNFLFKKEVFIIENALQYLEVEEQHNENLHAQHPASNQHLSQPHFISVSTLSPQSPQELFCKQISDNLSSYQYMH